MTPSDADLVAGVLAGDRQAFAGVYERYADRLYDFAFSMLRSREEASDCVADSFVVMAEKLGQLRDPAALRPWLYSVVRNECLRALRGRARLAHDDEWLEAMPDQGDGPAQQVERDAVQEELRVLVWDAIAGLNDRDRSLLDLHLRQGLEGAELAAAMDVTTANSYVMLSRARDQVERALGALLIARRGSEDCDQLSELLHGWDGSFSPLIRKRVARHIDGCDVCEHRRRLMVSPLALLGGVPAFAAPAALKDRVLDDPRLVACYVDSPVVPAAAPGVGTGGRRRRGLLLALAAALLLVLATGAVWWAQGDDDLLAVDEPSPVATTSALPSPSEEPSSPGPEDTPAATSPSPSEPASEPTTEPTATTSTEPTLAVPGDLEVSTRVLDLGASGSSGSVRLRNVGGSPLSFTARARSGWLSVERRSGSLDAGGSTDLTVTADRSGLAEGAHSGQVAVSSAGRTVVVTVRLSVDRPPVIGPISADSTSCSVPVSAVVTDGSGVRSVQVRWTGAVSGRSSASPASGGRWRTTIPVPVGGSVRVTFTAADDGGLRTSRSRTFTFDPCPG